MALCAIVTGYSYKLTKSEIEIRNNSIFKNITDTNLEALRVRMQLYSHSLDGAARLMVLSQSFTRFQYHFASVICLPKQPQAGHTKYEH
jgi:hypothetical protein